MGGSTRVCVREKESETLSVRQTGKPTDCYRQALAGAEGWQVRRAKERRGRARGAKCLVIGAQGTRG